MSQTTKFFITAIMAGLLLSAGLTALAQEEPTSDITEDVALDEDVEPEDLDTKEPKLLPDSPFYFLKNWGRKVRLFFAFSAVAKTELRERFTNEKLLELQKVSRKTIRAEIIEKAIENYQQELNEMAEVVNKIKKKASEDPEVDKFLDKFVQHQALHQRVLAKLEEQVPSEVFAKIKENRERHLEKFGEVMTKLEDKEKIQARIENNLGKESLELLERLEEKVPEQTKEAIEKARETIRERKREINEENGACITLWDPVCGVDGKTYSNDCFAKLANAEIDYRGECKKIECKTDADCPPIVCKKAPCPPFECIEEKCVIVKEKIEE